jgi:hypothetical protein
VQELNAGAESYAVTEAANVSPLQTARQDLLGVVKAPTQTLLGSPIGNGTTAGGARAASGLIAPLHLPPRVTQIAAAVKKSAVTGPAQLVTNTVTNLKADLASSPAQAVQNLPNFGYGNIGHGNVGLFNTGDLNVGIANTGNLNIGIGNISPDLNFDPNHITTFGGAGLFNNGIDNIGGWNSGTHNLGIANTGTFNSGLGNHGDGNHGLFNTGNDNLGIGLTGNNEIGIGPLHIAD